jgi:cytochrome c oxidase subunit II
MVVPWAAAPPRAPRRWCGGAAVSVLLVAIPALTACERGDAYPQTTFRPVTAFGTALNAVFYNTFWWTIGILILVVALILYAAVRFRERPGAPPPAQIHGNTKLELTWTIVPALIVIFISVPTVRTIFATQRRPPESALVVEVIGHQWWWEFHYPLEQVTTANVLYIPTGRPISLVLHSADVIHSFWIPRIGGKRDVNPLPKHAEDKPGRAQPNYLTFTVDEPGEYSGQCAEFCGESHGIMRMSAMAVTPEAFEQWVARMHGPGQAAAPTGPPQPAQAATQQPPLGQMPAPTGAGNPFLAPVPDSVLQAEGKRIFLGGACIACHTIAGTSARGTIGPNLTMLATRPYIGAGALENTRDNLVRWIRDPAAVKPGALMPGALRAAGGVEATGLSGVEIRAVAAYLSSLK